MPSCRASSHPGIFPPCVSYSVRWILYPLSHLESPVPTDGKGSFREPVPSVLFNAVPTPESRWREQQLLLVYGHMAAEGPAAWALLLEEEDVRQKRMWATQRGWAVDLPVLSKAVRVPGSLSKCCECIRALARGRGNHRLNSQTF